MAEAAADSGSIPGTALPGGRGAARGQHPRPAWRDRVPGRPELVHAFAVDVTGLLVAREAVEGMPGVGDLRLAVGAGDGAELRRGDPAAGHRLAVRAKGHPVPDARAGAGAAHARVGLEQVQRPAL